MSYVQFGEVFNLHNAGENYLWIHQKPLELQLRRRDMGHSMPMIRLGDEYRSGPIAVPGTTSTAPPKTMLSSVVESRALSFVENPVMLVTLVFFKGKLELTVARLRVLNEGSGDVDEVNDPAELHDNVH
ncbi:MAG: hypothetical protein M1834_007232 [Cirrosporium novae-zelandiae]|nr:MAG: hypothetical protein M1834_007232 [Cirrosporium novae-zelandiae]